MAAVKRLSVFHYSVIYSFWFFVITESIPGVLQIYLRTTDETSWVESS